MNRWRRFRATPGARFGLAVMIFFFVVGAGADLIASDVPLLTIGSWTLRAPIPFAPDAQHPGGISSVLAPPSRAHWLGTDDRGRDVAARLVHGARVALLVGPLAVAFYVAFGLVIGVAAAFGRRVDFIVGRVVEVGLMFPTLLLLLAIQGVTSSTSLVRGRAGHRASPSGPTSRGSPAPRRCGSPRRPTSRRRAPSAPVGCALSACISCHWRSPRR